MNFTTRPIVLLLASMGLERIFVEFYKTHITRKVRGIHEGKKPRYTHWFKRRWIFLLTFLLSVGTIAVLLLTTG